MPHNETRRREPPPPLEGSSSTLVPESFELAQAATPTPDLFPDMPQDVFEEVAAPQEAEAAKVVDLFPTMPSDVFDESVEPEPPLGPIRKLLVQEPLGGVRTTPIDDVVRGALSKLSDVGAAISGSPAAQLAARAYNDLQADVLALVRSPEATDSVIGGPIEGPFAKRPLEIPMMVKSGMNMSATGTFFRLANEEEIFPEADFNELSSPERLGAVIISLAEGGTQGAFKIGGAAAMDLAKAVMGNPRSRAWMMRLLTNPRIQRTVGGFSLFEAFQKQGEIRREDQPALSGESVLRTLGAAGRGASVGAAVGLGGQAVRGLAGEAVGLIERSPIRMLKRELRLPRVRAGAEAAGSFVGEVGGLTGFTSVSRGVEEARGGAPIDEIRWYPTLGELAQTSAVLIGLRLPGALVRGARGLENLRVRRGGGPEAAPLEGELTFGAFQLLKNAETGDTRITFLAYGLKEAKTLEQARKNQAIIETLLGPTSSLTTTRDPSGTTAIEAVLKDPQSAVLSVLESTASAQTEAQAKVDADIIEAVGPGTTISRPAQLPVGRLASLGIEANTEDFLAIQRQEVELTRARQKAEKPEKDAALKKELAEEESRKAGVRADSERRGLKNLREQRDPNQVLKDALVDGAREVRRLKVALEQLQSREAERGVQQALDEAELSVRELEQELVKAREKLGRQLRRLEEREAASPDDAPTPQELLGDILGETLLREVPPFDATAQGPLPKKAVSPETAAEEGVSLPRAKEQANRWFRMVDDPKSMMTEALSRDPTRYEKFLNQFVDVRGLAKHRIQKAFPGTKQVLSAKKVEALSEADRAARSAIARLNLSSGMSVYGSELADAANRAITKGFTPLHERGLALRIFDQRIEELDANYSDPPIRHPANFTGRETQHLWDAIKQQAENGGEPIHPKFAFTMDDIALIESRTKLWRVKIKELGIDTLLDAGLINATQHEALAKFENYSPREYLEYIDPGSVRTGTGNTLSADSGIRSLGSGDMGPIETNPMEMLRQIATRTVTRAQRNSAKFDLLMAARAKPDNGLILGPEAALKDGSAPKGFTKMEVLVDGAKVPFFVEDHTAESWIGEDPELTRQTSKMLRVLSGVAVLKPFATGVFNPEFGLNQFVRDPPYMMFVSGQYSNFVPMAIAQMGIDMASSLPQALAKSGPLYDGYISKGGGMTFLSEAGRVFTSSRAIEGAGKARPVLEKMRTLEDVMGAIGPLGEMTVRLSVFRRSIVNQLRAKNGGREPSTEEIDNAPEGVLIEAATIARSSLDFNNAGTTTRTIDQTIPYFSAGVQGTRGMARALRQDPKGFSAKFVQMVGFAAWNHYRNLNTDREGMRNIPTSILNRNWIWMTPLFEKDEDGNTVNFYLTIPMDPGQRMFAPMGAMLAEGLMGVDVTQPTVPELAKTMLQSFLPTDSPVAPGATAFLGAASARDLRFGGEIEGMPSGGPFESITQEHNELINPAWVAAAHAIGTSPARLRYVVDQYIPLATTYPDALGALGQVLAGLPEEEKEQSMENILTQLPFVRKAFRKTSPRWREFQAKFEAEKRGNTARLEQRRRFTALVEKDKRGEPVVEDMKRFIIELSATTKQPGIRFASLLNKEMRRQVLQEKGVPLAYLMANDMPVHDRAMFYAEQMNDVRKSYGAHTEEGKKKVIPAMERELDRLWAIMIQSGAYENEDFQRTLSAELGEKQANDMFKAFTQRLSRP